MIDKLTTSRRLAQHNLPVRPNYHLIIYLRERGVSLCNVIVLCKLINTRDINTRTQNYILVDSRLRELPSVSVYVYISTCYTLFSHAGKSQVNFQFIPATGIFDDLLWHWVQSLCIWVETHTTNRISFPKFQRCIHFLNIKKPCSNVSFKRRVKKNIYSRKLSLVSPLVYNKERERERVLLEFSYKYTGYILFIIQG